MRVEFRQKGDFKNTEAFLKRNKNMSIDDIVAQYGRRGVEALRSATPRDTGKTADSWSYSVEKNSTGLSLIFNNSNENHGVKIALLIQYGHGTGTGGWVEGRDFINPALQPVFDELAQSLWEKIVERR